MSAQPILEVQNLSFAYHRRRDVLREVQLSLVPGHLVALLGINGSGKTTLLKNLNRLLEPRHGSVLIDGRDIAQMSPRRLARQVGYMPQKNNGAKGTVFDAVLLGRKPHITWEANEHDLQVVAENLERLGLQDYAMRPAGELSGGELQKVIIARALAQEPKILLLDEPISHLDLKNQMQTMTLLHDISRKLELLVVTVLHDLTIALRFADRFVLLKDGKVFACGGREVVTPEVIREVYQVDATVHDCDGIPVVVPR
jgi:iron complex transport system ATP-binding protein